MLNYARPCIRIVEDEPGTRKLLAILIDGCGFLSRSYASAEQFIAEDNLSEPGCVLVDLELTGLSGTELVRWISQQPNPLPTIIVTGYGSAQSAVQCLKSGAVDFLEKPIDSARLLELVRSAVELDARLRLSRQHVSELSRRQETLSPRERQVMLCVCRGLSTKEIAVELAIAAKTVEHHRAQVMSKMEAGSIAELVKAVVDLGL